MMGIIVIIYYYIIVVILATVVIKADSSGNNYNHNNIQKDNKNRNNNNSNNNCNDDEDDPLNFVILLLDDHGYGDVGLYDSSTTETPNIDALGKSGIQFTDFHSGASLCTPSRAALLTGRYGLRTGVITNFSPQSLGGLPNGEISLAELLPSSSYNKHMIGKWHLGHNPPYHPSYRGFDTFFGLPYSGDMGCLDIKPHSCKPNMDRSIHTPACPSSCYLTDARVGIPLYDTPGINCSSSSSDGNNSSRTRNNGKKNHHLENNNSDDTMDRKEKCDKTITEQPVNEFTLNHRYAQRAEDIIATEAAAAAAAANNNNNNNNNNNCSKKKPFLLYIGFAHTHTPMAYDKEKWGNSSNRPGWKRHYGNTLAEVDDSIGRVVEAIHRHGMTNNTVIILTSDNGPADVSRFDCDFVGSSGPYQGIWQQKPTETPNGGGGGGGGTMKTTVWEGGHRVVGIVSWPGTIDAGRINHDLISALDIVPTIASLAGIPLPDDRTYDGMDISSLLKDETVTMSTLLQKRRRERKKQQKQKFQQQQQQQQQQRQRQLQQKYQKSKREQQQVQWEEEEYNSNGDDGDSNTSTTTTNTTTTSETIQEWKNNSNKITTTMMNGQNDDNDHDVKEQYQYAFGNNNNDPDDIFSDDEQEAIDLDDDDSDTSSNSSTELSLLNNDHDKQKQFHRVLFHSRSGGPLDAMRVGRYKLLFVTGGAAPCNYVNNIGFPVQHHMPPLVFDVVADPGESQPIPVSLLPPKLLYAAIHAREAKMKNINSTLSHRANYGYGTKWDSAGCCNRHSDVCRCRWQEKEKEEEEEQQQQPLLPAQHNEEQLHLLHQKLRLRQSQLQRLQQFQQEEIPTLPPHLIIIRQQYFLILFVVIFLILMVVGIRGGDKKNKNKNKNKKNKSNYNYRHNNQMDVRNKNHQNKMNNQINNNNNTRNGKVE